MTIAYICGPDGPVEVNVVENTPPDCIVEVDGMRFPVLCSMIVASPDDCNTNVSSLSEGDRVLVTLPTDAPEFRTASLLGRFVKEYNNGRLKIELDGLSGSQSISRTSVFKL